MGPVSGLTQVVCPHGTHADLMRSAYFSGNALNELFAKNSAILLQAAELDEDIVLLRGGEPLLRALGANCPHQGCQVRPKEHFLICPCHGSTFNLQGEPTRGPAQNPLNRYPVEIVDGGARVLIG
ncbi:MAG: Rieske 2Fe-2S domain-containing protein [Candidatus Latescibacteria bacterium]|nr:Rieske 2Fe-2S domain-containing protein [Candidatus Latescibacterota bacterium]